MNDFIDACIKANKEIYEYIKTKISFKDLTYSGKIGFGGDKSLIIDLKAEAIFISYLKKYGDIYSEESGYISSNTKTKIIIDPIDGSDNLMVNLPCYGTSVALQKDGIIIAAVICNLATGILTYKANNINLEKIDLKTLCKLKIKDVPYEKFGIFERSYKNPNICRSLYEKSIKFRSLGAIALSLCDAKNYAFVLFYGKTREFDIAAGLYFCENLYIYKDDDFLIVSKNIYYFNVIKDIINKL